MYDFNLLVSCSWRRWGAARREILKLMRFLGDERPVVQRTDAKGIVGVRTSLEPRAVIKELRALSQRHPHLLQHTSKWVPIDLWTSFDVDAMRAAVADLRGRIEEGETWRMTVEQRRPTGFHTMDIIKMLATLVTAKVDLEHPDKILRIDIIGGYAGLSAHTPEEICSVVKPAR